MGVAEIIGIIVGVFKFWDQVVWIVKLMQKTPAEKHADLLKRIQGEAESFAQTNRPKWD